MQYSTTLFHALCILLPALSPVLSTPIAEREPTCIEVVFPVSVSALNAPLAGLSLDNPLGSLASALFTIPVVGTFNIAARYCEPEVIVASRTSTLQLLVHGATYDRNYWFGDGAPGAGFNGDTYSWAAITDPIAVVQYPVEVETVHQIISKIRSSNPLPLPRKFTKIIYASHSYGSTVGNALVSKYPADVDALILTGYSNKYELAIPGSALSGTLLPADVVLPARFGNLNPAYLTFPTFAGWSYLFWWPGAGAFDPALQSLDFGLRGTFATGEVLTFAVAINIAPKYKGPVYVVTGQHDAIFCNPLGLQQSQLDCGTSTSGYVASTKSLFPAASTSDAFVVPNSGHCWHFHTAGPSASVTIHNWMAGKGF